MKRASMIALLTCLISIDSTLFGSSDAIRAQTTNSDYEPQLYAPKPPPGSSYVRLVNAGVSPISVVLGSSAPVTLSRSGSIVSTYRIVLNGQRLSIAIDGKPPTKFAVPGNQYMTLFYEGNPEETPPAITDDPGEDDGLLAQLRFYNLVSGCNADLLLASGPVVFGDVSPNRSKSRSINAVSATFIPRCGTHRGSPFALPLLKARDHYSIFLVGDADKLTVVGSLDVTEPFKP